MIYVGAFTLYLKGLLNVLIAVKSIRKLSGVKLRWRSFTRSRIVKTHNNNNNNEYLEFLIASYMRGYITGYEYVLYAFLSGKGACNEA